MVENIDLFLSRSNMTSSEFFSLPDTYLDEIKGYFNRTSATNDALSSILDQDMQDTVLSICGNMKIKKNHSSWDSMVDEINNIYQDTMG